ncbi:MAG: 50S ribosomal protein L24 [Candidatus Omnitrophota bacterium]
MSIQKIKKNDTVYVLSGRDRGKTGRVLKIFAGGGRALVEGVNIVKKHTRKTSQNQQQAGIVEKEAAISLSSVAVFCKTCKKQTRIGVSVLADSSKVRFCKRCKENF